MWYESAYLIIHLPDEDTGIEEEHTFTDIYVGQGKEADVTLPGEYVLVS